MCVTETSEKKPDKVPKFRYKQDVVVLEGFLRDHIGYVRDIYERGGWVRPRKTFYLLSFRDRNMGDAWTAEDCLKKWTKEDDEKNEERRKVAEEKTS
jgi:hypothetical protein